MDHVIQVNPDETRKKVFILFMLAGRIVHEVGMAKSSTTMYRFLAALTSASREVLHKRSIPRPRKDLIKGIGSEGVRV